MLAPQDERACLHRTHATEHFDFLVSHGLWSVARKKKKERITESPMGTVPTEGRQLGR